MIQKIQRNFCKRMKAEEELNEDKSTEDLDEDLDEELSEQGEDD